MNIIVQDLRSEHTNRATLICMDEPVPKIVQYGSVLRFGRAYFRTS